MWTVGVPQERRTRGRHAEAREREAGWDRRKRTWCGALRALAAAVAATAIVAAPAPAQVRRTVELYAGTSYSFPTPLSIRQDGEPDIRLTARYSTRPWSDSPYYAYRFGYQDGTGGWEGELIHQKLYLENLPPGVQRFEVTHGYNLVTVNRTNVRANGTTWRLGVGLVIGHPESTVRGRVSSGRGGLLNRGYHVAGLTLQLSVGRRFPDRNEGSDGLFVAPEGKLTASWARVPVAGGSAVAPNVAVHGLVGLGYAY